MKTKLGLLSFALAALFFFGQPPASSSAYVAVSVGIAPPAIPVYEQPFCPAPGYIWVPGYWAWGEFGYYWVPGAWVLAPRVGFLWTPGYWGYRNGNYYFNDGYWGSSVGFYGGINYGYGYYGSGYYGGRWDGNVFRYNTAVSRVNTNVITNTYVNREVAQNVKGPRKSFNGPGGVQAKPTAREQAAAKAEHIAPTSAQKTRVAAARNDPGLRAKNNKGRPNPDAVRTFENKHRPSAAERTAATRTERGNRQAGENNRAGENKTNNRTARETKGNAAVGHRQGDVTTRTKGPQNSAHGKARSAEVQSSRGSKKAARNEEAASSRSREATQARRREAPKAARAPREVHRAPTVERRPKAASHRPEAAPRRQSANPRQAAPGRGGPGQAQQEQSKKKRKKRGDDR
ncbi:MAG TPA: hypothetical protein VH207_12795 [Chthoniobacterales bacterium]|jgi:hypothetical protein|nr:hypothetical protein [Chthoniobacterales bacterium]